MNSGLDIALPKSWTWSPLKFATTFLNRGTAPVYVDVGPVRAISQAANQLAGLDWDRTRFHDHNGDPKRLRGYLVPGDVLINSTGTGTLGRVGYFTGGPDALPCVADGHVTVTRADGKVVDSRFLYYWLGSRPFYDYINSTLIIGATNQIELNRERLAAAPTVLPPRDEQRRIVDFLDAEIERIDQLRASTTLQIDLLDARRTEEFRRATTGSSYTENRATGIPWMPTMAAGWRLFKVGRSFRTGSGTTPRSSDPAYFNGQHYWVNTGDLRDSVVDLPAKRVSDAALKDYPTLRIYPPGALMVAMYGATTGRVGINAVPACVNQACCVLSPGGKLDVNYAFYWFLAHRPEIVGLASGGGQPNISQDLVRSLRIPAPTTICEQRIIAKACQRIAADTASYQTQLVGREKLLVERRQALITAAVTGQIDVTTARGIDL